MNSNSNSSKTGRPDTTIIKFPCKLCPKMLVTMIMQFYVTSLGGHIKCNHLGYIDYKYVHSCNELWCCLSCASIVFQFVNLNNQTFLAFISNNVN